MSDFNFLDWITTASPSQFFLGVILLVFGSKKIFSEKNVSESLGGIFLPFKVLRKRRAEAAEREAAEIEELRREIADLNRERLKQHRWALAVTEWVMRLELWAAKNHLHLPEPSFIHWVDFEKIKKEDDDAE